VGADGTGPATDYQTRHFAMRLLVAVNAPQVSGDLANGLALVVQLLIYA
jgi:hypothetical protein